MSRTVLFLWSLATLASAATCPKDFFKYGALLIGISDPGLEEGPKPLKFAGADVDRMEKLLGDRFRIFKIQDSEAKTAAVSQCLKDFSRFAQEGGKTIVFISARGFSSTELTDGFVLTWDAAIDKLPGNGLSTGELLQRIRGSRSAEKYLLLDLCRDPPEKTGFDNLINNRVLDSLGTETGLIVLASKDSDRSFESAGLGVYAAGLAGTLKYGLTLKELFDALTNKTKPKQIPSRPTPPGDGWQDCPLCVPPLQKSRLQTPIQKMLLASLVPVSLFQDPQPQGSAELAGIAEAVRKEEDGQRIFIRYGEGNHFPGDPLYLCDKPRADLQNFRLCREEYETAANQFEQAAGIREKIGREEDQSLIQSLKERARICRALADPLNGHSVSAALGDAATFQLAESHNVLGIAELEQGNYTDAEKQFGKAREKAPHWAYPRHNLALTYVEHGRYSDAEKEYREAIRLTPVGGKVSDKDNPCFHGRKVMVSARPYLYYNLGVLLQRVNRLADAQQQYCLAEASFHSQMEQFQVESGASDADQATLANFRYKAAKRNVADVDNSLGVLFEARNRIGKAEERFGKAVDNDEKLSAASFNLARIEAKKNPAKARQLYQAVLDGPSCKGLVPQDLGCQAAQKTLDQLPKAPAK